MWSAIEQCNEKYNNSYLDLTTGGKELTVWTIFKDSTRKGSKVICSLLKVAIIVDGSTCRLPKM